MTSDMLPPHCWMQSFLLASEWRTVTHCDGPPTFLSFEPVDADLLPGFRHVIASSIIISPITFLCYKKRVCVLRVHDHTEVLNYGKLLRIWVSRVWLKASVGSELCWWSTFHPHPFLRHNIPSLSHPPIPRDTQWDNHNLLPPCFICPFLLRSLILSSVHPVNSLLHLPFQERI